MKTPRTPGRIDAAQLPLMEQSAESITFPRADSSAGIIGKSLLRAAILNSTDWTATGPESTKLTSRVSDLIGKFGWHFICKTPAKRIRANGTSQRVTFYAIPRETLQALRQDPRVRAFLSDGRQRGYIAPHLLGLLAVAVPVVAVLVAVAARWM